MSKISASLIFMVSLLGYVTRCQVQLNSSTSCFGNCIGCTSSSPFECPFSSSLIEPNKNLNCLPFFGGKNCDQLTSGFYEMVANNLNGWEGEQKICTVEGTQFITVKPRADSNSLSYDFNIAHENIETLIFKWSLFGNLTNDTLTQNAENTNQQIDPNTIDIFNPGALISTETRTTINSEGSSVSIQISGNDISQTISLTPTKVSTFTPANDCGEQFQFVYKLDLPTSLNSTSFKVTITFQKLNQNFSLKQFTIYGGCNGFTVSTGNEKCSSCLSGFYEIRNNIGNDLASCRRCDFGCQTCTTNGNCTSCKPNTAYNSSSQRCQYTTNYKSLRTYEILNGTMLETVDGLVEKPVFTSSNLIKLRFNLQSVNSYSLRFFLLYTNEFLERGDGKEIIIFQNDESNVKVKINILQELEKYSGTYLKQIGNGTRQVFFHEVEINQLKKNITDSSNELIIGIKARRILQSNTPIGNTQFGISHVEVVQFTCPDNCQTCQSQSNQNICQSCRSFFDLDSRCRYCPNGFFLKKYWKNSTTNANGVVIPSLETTKEDMCVKCHVTCKQCVGQSLHQCKQCFEDFVVKDILYNTECIRCLDNENRNNEESPQCRRCLMLYPLTTIKRDSDCNACLGSADFNSLTSGTNCERCWLKSGLGHGRCTPDPLVGYTFYGTDANSGSVQESSWTPFLNGQTSVKMEKFTCTDEYKNLWGVIHKQNTKDSVLSLQWKQSNMPIHTGMIIMFNIIKINDWQTSSPKEKNNISIIIFSDNTELENFVFSTGNEYGSDICNGPGNQMLYTFVGVYDDHKVVEFNNVVQNREIRVNVTGTGDGLFVRQLEVYLGNCDECSSRELRYEVGWLPRYRNTEEETGLDVYLTFNGPVQFEGNDSELEKAFVFKIDQLDNVPLRALEFENDLENNQRLRYFLPLDKSFIDGKLSVETNEEQRIFSQGTSRRLLLNSRLSSPDSLQPIDRYSNVNLDQRYSMSQIETFFTIFEWIALIGVIITVLCGVSIIVEQFSILLQIIFLHVYVSSNLLPASFKAPLIGLQRMENLNYFAEANAQNIEQQWFGDFVNPSPFIFQQYNVDNYFARSFYPIIIINIVYVLWFLLLLLLNKCIAAFRDSDSNFLRFVRNIPQRPINYFDQIWRYQFLTTMWASFIQFYSVRTDTAAQSANLALCIVAFIISIAWLFFIIIYTYSMTKYKYATNFLHQYEDIFFKKISTFGDQNSRFYIYIGVRFARYFFYALFIALFIEHEIIGPVILIIVNVIEAVYILVAKIYVNDLKAVFFKVVENVLLVVLEIELLFVYGLSNSISDDDFLNLGYAMIVIVVLLIINGMIRLVYFGYEKAHSFYYNIYGEEMGEKKVYKNTPLPATDRVDQN